MLHLGKTIFILNHEVLNHEAFSEFIFFCAETSGQSTPVAMTNAPMTHLMTHHMTKHLAFIIQMSILVFNKFFKLFHKVF